MILYLGIKRDLESMSPKKQFIIFLTCVVGIVLILVAIFSFRSNPNGSKKEEVKKVFSLGDYAKSDTELVVTTNGPINGDDLHRAVRIRITSEHRTMEVIHGYQGKVVKTETYPNNPEAYRDFILALQDTGFGRARKGVTRDEVGVCPTGRRYVHEVRENGESVSRTWSATCSKGSSLAAAQNVNNLFQMQITDFNKIIKDVKY